MAATLGIIRGHAGAMRVHSEPGRGTTVRMILPAVEEGPAADEPSTLSEITATKGLVLVIDDEPAVLDFLETALPHLGYDVVLAQNGEQALSIASERMDELIGVILDVTMPGMTGEQVFQELNGLAPELPVLVSSGFSADDIASRFPGKRLQGFLQKPYRLGELSEKLHQFTKV